MLDITCSDVQTFAFCTIWNKAPKYNFCRHNYSVKGYIAAQSKLTILRQFFVLSGRLSMHATYPKSLAPQANTLPDFVRIKLVLDPAAIWTASTPRKTGISNKFVQKRMSLSSTFTTFSEVDIGRTARDEFM